MKSYYNINKKADTYYKLNSITVTLSLCFTISIPFYAQAGTVSHLGITTGVNSIAIGQDSFATSTNGVAIGDQAVASGENITREFFNKKKVEQDAFIKDIKEKRAKIAQINNNINTKNSEIFVLHNILASYTETKSRLDEKKNKLNKINEEKSIIEKELTIKEAKLAENKNRLKPFIKSRYANLPYSHQFYQKYMTIRFSDLLSELDWTSTKTENELAIDLKNKVNETFGDLFNNPDIDYENAISSYKKREGQIIGSKQRLDREFYANNSSAHGEIIPASRYSVNSPEQGSTGITESYHNGNDIKGYIDGLVFNVSPINATFIPGVNLTTTEDEMPFIYSEAARNNRIDLYAKGADSKVKNTHILMATSVSKAIKHNVFNPLIGYSDAGKDAQYYMSRHATGIPKSFTYTYNQNLFHNYDTAYAVRFAFKKKDSTTDIVRPLGYDLPVLNILVKLANNSDNINEFLDSSLINDFKVHYVDFKKYEEDIDWGFDKSAINLIDYQAKLTKVKNYYEKINNIIALYEEVIQGKRENNIDQNILDQKSRQLLAMKSEILNGTSDITNFLAGITFEYTNEARKYLEYGKLEADKWISDAINELNVYDEEKGISKVFNDQVDSLLKDYDDARYEKNNTINKLNNLTLEMENYVLTSDEEKTLENISNIEKKKQNRETEKTTLEEEKGKIEKSLEYVNKKLADEGFANRGKNSLAQGFQAFASGDNAIALGVKSTAIAENTIALGHFAEATKINSVAIGNGAKATVENSVALGSYSETTSAKTDHSAGIIEYRNSDVIDRFNQQINQFAGAIPVGTVSVGKVGAERRIQNVAAGLVSAKSTDAVNGSQLYALAHAINLGQAGLVRQDSNPNHISSDGINHNRLTVGSTTGGQEINFSNLNGENRRLTGVSEGINTNDAVNKAQLDKAISTTTSRINYVERKLKEGVANAVAIGGLSQAYLPSQGLLSVGVGNYSGVSSIAVGISHINDKGKVIIRLGGSASQKGTTAASASIGFAW